MKSIAKFQCVFLRRILLAVRAEAAKSPIVIFLCQHETWQKMLLHLPTALKSLIF